MIIPPIIHADNENFKRILDSEISQLGPMADLNHIDVSKVTFMGYAFDRSDFNGDISKWDVSNVIGMEYMFNHSEFNGDISNWNLKSLISMSCMFYDSKFNGDISSWDVSNVRHMNALFRGSNFQGDISCWNIRRNLVMDDDLKRVLENSHNLRNQREAINLKIGLSISNQIQSTKSL